MSETTGTTIACDRYECGEAVTRDTPEDARAVAAGMGWTRTVDERDFCRACTEMRASRKSPSELVPEGVRVMEVFDAAEAAGWERRDYDPDEGTAHFFCCGQEVEVSSLLGSAYGARCDVCETAIADVTGPRFEGSAVAFADPDKVDTETDLRWIVVAEHKAACERERATA